MPSGPLPLFQENSLVLSLSSLLPPWQPDLELLSQDGFAGGGPSCALFRAIFATCGRVSGQSARPSPAARTLGRKLGGWSCPEGLAPAAPSVWVSFTRGSCREKGAQAQPLDAKIDECGTVLGPSTRSSGRGSPRGGLAVGFRHGTLIPTPSCPLPSVEGSSPPRTLGFLRPPWADGQIQGHCSWVGT